MLLSSTWNWNRRFVCGRRYYGGNYLFDRIGWCRELRTVTEKPGFSRRRRLIPATSQGYDRKYSRISTLNLRMELLPKWDDATQWRDIVRDLQDVDHASSLSAIPKDCVEPVLQAVCRYGDRNLESTVRTVCNRVLFGNDLLEKKDIEALVSNIWSGLSDVWIGSSSSVRVASKVLKNTYACSSALEAQIPDTYNPSSLTHQALHDTIDIMLSHRFAGSSTSSSSSCGDDSLVFATPGCVDYAIRAFGSFKRNDAVLACLKRGVIDLRGGLPPRIFDRALIAATYLDSETVLCAKDEQNGVRNMSDGDSDGISRSHRNGPRREGRRSTRKYRLFDAVSRLSSERVQIQTTVHKISSPPSTVSLKDRVPPSDASLASLNDAPHTTWVLSLRQEAVSESAAHRNYKYPTAVLAKLNLTSPVLWQIWRHFVQVYESESASSQRRQMRGNSLQGLFGELSSRRHPQEHGFLREVIDQCARSPHLRGDLDALTVTLRSGGAGMLDERLLRRLIFAYARVDSFDTVRELLPEYHRSVDRMEGGRFKIGPHMWSVMLEAYLRVGAWEDAEFVISEMSARQIRPSSDFLCKVASHLSVRAGVETGSSVLWKRHRKDGGSSSASSRDAVMEWLSMHEFL